jgi:hypothetical protein
VFIVYLIAGLGIVVWRSWRRALPVAGAAALATIALALFRPPLGVAAAVATAACLVLVWAHGGRGKWDILAPDSGA